MERGSFADFLGALREFESGVSLARIEQNRAEVIRQVGQERFDAFEAGDVTLTDLQYSSENFLGFVGYQFGEAILIDLGYYEFDATPGVNDFSGNFTGKNGVNGLDDLKTNVQETIIVEEFQLNLQRIENGLANAGQSLDDFIGRTVTVTDTDGSQSTVELTLTGILASAHLRGAFGTLDFLRDNVASADEIGTSNVQFINQFGGFDAPSVDQLIDGAVAPLVTDATLTIDNPFGARNDSGEQPDAAAQPDPAAQPADPEPTPPPAQNNPDDGANDQQVFSPAGAPAAPAAALIRDFDPATGGFTVTGTDGNDGTAFGNTGDDVIVGFAGDDALVGFEGNDFLDGGAGSDRIFGSQDDDIILGGAGDDIIRGDNEAAGNGADIIVGGAGNDLLKGDGNNLVGTDTFVFAPGDGADIIQDFQPGVDKLDFSAFGNVAINVTQQGGDTLLRVGDVSVTLQGVNANDLSDDDFAQANIAAGDDVVVEDEVEEVVLENNDNGGDNNAGNAAGLSLVGGRAVDDVERRVVSGTDGNDVLNQSNFVDPVDIDGGAGDDQITGTSVAGVSDVLRGGAGNDTFFGLAGDDFLIPGAGDDLRVVGGAGSDTFFPETNGGNDIFPEFSLQDRLDGTLLDGVTAINVSRLDNGRTFLEFEGANTTVQISGGVSPEQFIANANQLLVNFPDGVQVQLAGADVANVVNDNDVVEEVDGAPVREQIVVENNDGDNAGVGVNAADFGIAAPAAPAAVQQSVANDRGGLTVTGTNGNDGVAFGNTGDDIIVGFDGDDALVGFNGNDFLDGGAGNDRVFGSQGDDIVLGGAGDDIVRGDNEAAGNGADIIVGGAGNDLLKGDGNNLVGADTFVFAPGDGNDIIQDFQPGVDKFDVSAFGDVEIEIRQQGSDTLVTVGDVNVTLRGINADDLNADDFDGVSVAGNNNVVVEEQDEVVVVENNDGGGNNAAGGVNAADFGIAAPATPAAVQQTVANAQGGLTVTGTNGNDGVAFGNTGADVVVAFDGDDALVGFNGNDFLDGGAGNDRVFGSQDDDIVLGGAGDDIVRGDNEAAGNGADIIVGGAGNDLLKGDGNNLVGADTFVFAAGDGNDIIQDFQVGVDRLDVSAIDDGIVISLDQEGTNTIVSVADVTITLQNVDTDDLSEQDFIGATIEDSEIGTTPTFTTDDSLIG